MKRAAVWYLSAFFVLLAGFYLVDYNPEGWLRYLGAVLLGVSLAISRWSGVYLERDRGDL